MNERERRLQQRAQEREQQRRNRLISAGQNSLTSSLPSVSVPIVAYQDTREEERAKRRDAIESYNRKVAEERVKLQLSGATLKEKVSKHIKIVHISFLSIYI